MILNESQFRVKINKNLLEHICLNFTFFSLHFILFYHLWFNFHRFWVHLSQIFSSNLARLSITLRQFECWIGRKNDKHIYSWSHVEGTEKNWNFLAFTWRRNICLNLESAKRPKPNAKCPLNICKPTTFLNKYFSIEISNQKREKTTNKIKHVSSSWLRFLWNRNWYYIVCRSWRNCNGYGRDLMCCGFRMIRI